MNEGYLHIWAKTSARQDEGAAASFHPLIYHMLDVAAVAEQLLQHSLLLEEFAPQLDMSPAALRRLLVFCCALHDIGKCSAHFQAQVPQLWPGLTTPQFGSCPIGTLPKLPHGQISDIYMRAMLVEDEEKQALLTPLLRSIWGQIDVQHEGKLISAIAGHHGEPTQGREVTGKAQHIHEPFKEAALLIAGEIAEIMGVVGSSQIVKIKDKTSSALSWFLSALLPVADWIGSNQLWFPCMLPERSPREYWDTCARPRAKHAYAASGVLRANITQPSPQQTLPHLVDASLSPVQSHAFTCPMGAEGAALFLIEDATGSGKTEAALALTHRLMASGRAGGFYFALPSMATANAMYARLAQSYRALFDASAHPSLSLAHGNAQRNSDFLASLTKMHSHNGEEIADAGSYCSGWIADSRRKALLAQAGAGTIDQALMAILPMRYQSLRVYGLAGNVLILDEIHAFDPFMLGLIETLLYLHAMLGGSAILMSATLPIAARQRLVDAFSFGLHSNKHTPAQLNKRAYPLVSMVTKEGMSETPLPLVPRAERRVVVKRIASVADAEALAICMAKQGAAVALLRTTVDSAISSFERIKAQHASSHLFHARFLLDDRLMIERDMLERFGKNPSSQKARQGQILVATQVIEQSLDLDFDVFITDLAPIDLLIQRAGRLWRHKRENRPVSEPILHVISPEAKMTDTEKWLDNDLPEAEWVYGDVAKLWLSAKHLFDVSAIETTTLDEGVGSPAHVRQLVEAVYGVDAKENLPTDGLSKAFDRYSGEKLGERQAAKNIALEPLKGYVWTKSWESDARATTRLELNPRVLVRLARRDGNSLRPLGEDWSLSDVRLTKKAAQSLNEPRPQEAAALCPLWAEVDHGIRLLVLNRKDGDGWQSDDGRYRYDGVYGLRIGSDREES